MKQSNYNSNEKSFSNNPNRLWMKMILITLLFGQISQSIAQADFTITELNPITESVTIMNTGTQAQDITNYWVCLGPGNYRQLTALTVTSGDYDLNPSEAVTFTFDLLNESNGGLSFFTTNTFGSTDPNVLLDYVQWGAANQPRVGQAITAGRWDDAAGFVDGMAPYTTTTGGSAAAWSTTSAIDFTITGLNPITDAVTITNTGSQAEDITNYWVCLGPGNYRQLTALPVTSGDYDLNPSEAVTFTFDLLNESNGGLSFFSTNTFGSSDPDILLDYVQWGAPNQPRVGQAITAGRWGSADDYLSCPAPYSTEFGGSAQAWGEADGGTVEIDIAATGNPNNTTSIAADGLSAVICVDSRPDPLVVIHENPGVDPNISYRYVITANDADQTILAIAATNQIDLDGAGSGTCLIWGWSYLGVANNGDGFIGGPLADLDAEECSDISDNSIEVIREEADGGTVEIDIAATGNPNNTTSIAADGLSAVICVDSRPDPLVVIHSNPGAENLSYRYVVTANDADQTILAIAGTNQIDLDGAGPGTCLIWGWSYRGVPNNGDAFIGGPLADLDAESCSDISDNAIEVIREEADGGTVSLANGDTEVSICAGDGVADPLEVIHENPGAENLSYRYVVTDSDSQQTILAITGSSTIDLEGAGEGICLIWGWSYRGVPENGAAFIGGPLADLDAESCSDISDDFIEVNRLTGDDCDILSVDDLSLNASNVAIFPNPASDILNVSYSGNLTNDVSISVYDLRGRQLSIGSLKNSSSTQIDVASLTVGTYLIVMEQADGGTVTKRFIKR